MKILKSISYWPVCCSHSGVCYVNNPKSSQNSEGVNPEAPKVEPIPAPQILNTKKPWSSKECLHKILDHRIRCLYNMMEFTPEIYLNLWNSQVSRLRLHDFLLGGWAAPLKKMSSSVGMMTFPIYGKGSKPPISRWSKSMKFSSLLRFRVCIYG